MDFLTLQYLECNAGQFSTSPVDLSSRLGVRVNNYFFPNCVYSQFSQILRPVFGVVNRNVNETQNFNQVRLFSLVKVFKYILGGNENFVLSN